MKRILLYLIPVISLLGILNCDQNISVQGNKELDTLKLYTYDTLQTMWPKLQEMENLGYLFIGDFSQLKHLTVSNLNDLVFFSSYDNSHPESFSFEFCPKLEEIELIYSNLKSISLKNLPSLNKLDMGGCNQLESITIDSTLNNLKHFELWSCGYSLTDFSFLIKTPNLFRLDMDLTSGITDFSPLSFMVHLRKLSISCYNITDLTPLSNLTGVNYLGIRETSHLDDNDFEPIIKILQKNDTLSGYSLVPNDVLDTLLKNGVVRGKGKK